MILGLPNFFMFRSVRAELFFEISYVYAGPRKLPLDLFDFHFKDHMSRINPWSTMPDLDCLRTFTVPPAGFDL